MAAPADVPLLRNSVLVLALVAGCLVRAARLPDGVGGAAFGEAAPLAIACAALADLTGSAAGPTLAAATVFTGFTCLLVPPDGPFESVAQFVAPPAWNRFTLAIWPWTIAVGLVLAARRIIDS